MNKQKITLAVFILIVAVAFGAGFRMLRHRIPSEFTRVEKLPDIFPDYCGITVPVNCAPLNFNLTDQAKSSLVVFSGEGKNKIILRTGNSKIRIPVRRWRKFLTSCENGDYTVDTWCREGKHEWVRYKPYTNHVSGDRIDKTIVFRKINAAYILWERMGIYQRNLENFSQTPVLRNENTGKNCMNCHSFCNNDPGKMIIHLRRPPSGTLLYDHGKVKFLDTKTKYTMSPFVYPSWHPGGNLIAFSVNIIKQKFPAAGYRNIYVYDIASDIVVYDIDKNQVSTCPEISTGNLENLPAWSHDGKYLYYISAPKYNEKVPDTTMKYSLVRIAYDAVHATWGKPDSLLTSRETGKSITFPEISPDDRYLVFAMSDYGYFNVHARTSDLYMMDLKTMKYNKLPLNSNDVESYHSWSSSGRWLLFISKRMDGLYSNVFFSHVDSSGKVSKPFVLPQKDPDFYRVNTTNYNRPVFVTDKVTVDEKDLIKAAYTKAVSVEFDPGVDIDALSGATRIEQDVTKEHTN
jgi:WD40-like Beta Propeller Repeat